MKKLHLFITAFILMIGGIIAQPTQLNITNDFECDLIVEVGEQINGSGGCSGTSVVATVTVLANGGTATVNSTLGSTIVGARVHFPAYVQQNGNNCPQQFLFVVSDGNMCQTGCAPGPTFNTGTTTLPCGCATSQTINGNWTCTNGGGPGIVNNLLLN